MNLIAKIIIVALLLLSGALVYFAVTEQPPSQAELPIDVNTLPLKGTSETKASIALVPAGPAKAMGDLLHGLPSAKTKKELKERNAKIKQCRDALVKGGDESLPGISALMSDERQIVRAKAVGMLRAIGTAEAIRMLAGASVSGEKNTRLYALQEIEGLTPTKFLTRQSIRKLTVPSLLTSMADNNEEIRTSAARACWRVTQKRFNYDAKASKELRSKALAEFHKWWKTEGK